MHEVISAKRSLLTHFFTSSATHAVVEGRSTVALSPREFHERCVLNAREDRCLVRFEIALANEHREKFNVGSMLHLMRRDEECGASLMRLGEPV